jgi:hypothetical protein
LGFSAGSKAKFALNSILQREKNIIILQVVVVVVTKTVTTIVVVVVAVVIAVKRVKINIPIILPTLYMWKLTRT